jgi:hypothetical protein
VVCPYRRFLARSIRVPRRRFRLPVKSSADEQAYAGPLLNIGAHGAAQAARPQPRLQVYALGEITNAANGASTSRVGVDLALPVTPTSSFLASLHPDYSNVEIDQQSIAPSAFPRFYSEAAHKMDPLHRRGEGHVKQPREEYRAAPPKAPERSRRQ